MAKQYSEITDKQQQFIEQQYIFFIGTADKDGKVSVSPKGIDSLRILDKNRIVWVNYTGSGNETAAHMLATNRMTIMFCSFTEKTLILRIYGSGKVIYPKDDNWQELEKLFPESISNRQYFDINVDLVQTSCGFGVPLFDYKGERDLLLEWANKKGTEGIKAYWKNENKLSIDGKNTGI
ncbi:pyridoxamine 5'-phosphate oxidase family protein [Candidatus Halobeggiatoa sp. HSG11]|nr:pyridoxamine 5'-phosphate oxidase family protein [Candidatus Halobeggiatoa sp. HSG11]